MAELDLDHPNLRVRGTVGETLELKLPFGVSRAKIAGTQLPHQVATLQMVLADTALPGAYAKPPSFAPVFSALMAGHENAPKPMAEMLNIEA